MMVTTDNKKVRENLDFKILSKYSTRVTTQLCGVGDYEASIAWTQANVRYMYNNGNNDDDLHHVASDDEYYCLRESNETTTNE